MATPCLLYTFPSIASDQCTEFIHCVECAASRKHTSQAQIMDLEEQLVINWSIYNVPDVPQIVTNKKYSFSKVNMNVRLDSLS